MVLIKSIKINRVYTSSAMEMSQTFRTQTNINMSIFLLFLHFWRHRTQVWVVIVQRIRFIHCDFSFSNGSKVCEVNQDTYNQFLLWSTWFKRGKVSPGPRMQQLRLLLPQRLAPVSATHSCSPWLGCVQVPWPRPAVELRVMWQVLAAACCPHPAKARIQPTATSSLEREGEGGTEGTKRETQRRGQPIWEAACCLLGLNPLFGSCFWTCQSVDLQNSRLWNKVLKLLITQIKKGNSQFNHLI